MKDQLAAEKIFPITKRHFGLDAEILHFTKADVV